jgi:signal transduction histidine kinase
LESKQLNTEARSQVHQVLLSRCHAIADHWYQAIARTSHVPHSAAKVRQCLVELTEQAILLLFTEPFDRGRAEAIGASLANLHCLEPEALGGTQEVLARQLVEDLAAEQAVALQSRLAALLGGLVAGFSQRSRETVLAEQERSRGALVRELRRVKEALSREFALTEAMAAAAAVVSSTLDLDQVLDRILDQVSCVVPSDAANIMLIEGDRARIARWRGYERFGAEESISTLELHIPEIPGFQHIMKSGEPLVIPDIATYSGWVQVQEWLRSYAAAPIAVCGEVIGFLNVDSATPGFFTQAHAEALRAFANHAATAIENAQLYEAAQREITERKRAEARLLTYQQRLRSLASQLSLTEERERRRMATVLHDRVGQTLAICKIKLGALRQLASSTELAEPLDEVDKYLKEIIRATRALTLDISSPILYQLGLEAALEWLTEQTWERDGIPSEFRDDRRPKPLDDDVRVLLFQAVRELLVNVAKHAQAHSVKVAIQREDSNVQIIVEDDGVGFTTFPIGSHWSEIKGFGLFSIRERLDYLGGQLQIKSERGNGTRVTLVAPLKHGETTTGQGREGHEYKDYPG